MLEFIFEEIDKKIALALLIAFGGLVFVISRFVVSRLEKRSFKKTIDLIKRRPSLAGEIADSLDVPYSVKHPLTFKQFEMLKEYLSSMTKVGDYELTYLAPLGTDDLLVFSTLRYLDFDVGVTGKGTDVKKVSHLLLRLHYDHPEKQLVLYSDIYTTSTGKYQRNEFLSAVFTGSHGA